jgi:hypothetical protein
MGACREATGDELMAVLNPSQASLLTSNFFRDRWWILNSGIHRYISLTLLSFTLSPVLL